MKTGEEEPKPNTDRKDIVSHHFDRSTQHWNDVYEGESLEALHLRQRKERVLSSIDSIGLSTGAKALDLGCGAGMTTLALLQKGFHVDAFDMSENMLGVAKRNCLQAGYRDEVSFVQGDAEDLRFPAEDFDLVVSMGLFGYVPDWEGVIRDVARIVKPGGYLLVTFQAKFGLSHMVNPRALRLGHFRDLIRRNVLASKFPMEDRFSGREFKGILESNQFEVVSDSTFGFGPFLPLGQVILPDRLGLHLYTFLQRMADKRKVPNLSRMGKTYLVVARKAVNSGENSK